VLVDDAARAQRQRIVAAADDDLAWTSNSDRVVTVSGDHRAAAKNVNVNVAAARNTDGGAH